MATVRPPAVAGSFYPADPGRLTAMVDGFLADAARPPAQGRIRAVIAPHAGYVYSGPVAGHAFAPLDEAAARNRRVVVIGPAHFVPFRGLAAPSVDAFGTPIGQVPVDRASIEGLTDLPRVRIADRPHAEEHALEVELPFLQALLCDFALVPLVVGEAAPAEVAEVLARLWDDHTLLVISSDLSHYHPYETAQRRDAATAARIEALDESALGPYHACGWLPIAGLLIEARRRGLAVERRDLRTSGDTAGPKDRVVGYGAWVFRDQA